MKTEQSIQVTPMILCGGSVTSLWLLLRTTVKNGASIGGGASILAGITFGQGAMVGAEAVVRKSVLDKAMIWQSFAPRPLRSVQR